MVNTRIKGDIFLKKVKRNNHKLLLFMVMVSMFVLGACGSSEKDAGKENETTDQESSGEKYVIGFSQVGAESEWRTANTKSIQNAITDAGHELKFSDAQQKQENQIKAIRSFITQKVDAIVFSPVVETGFETVLQEATDADIPGFLSDRSVDIDDGSLWVRFRSEEQTSEWDKAAHWLIDVMSELAVDI